MTKHIKKGAGGKRTGAGAPKKAVTKPHTIRVTETEKLLIEKLRKKNRAT